MPYTATLDRIRAEYLEMPGLKLTVNQVQRLCGVERVLCQDVLNALVAANFLDVRADGSYVRLTEGRVARSQPARAEGTHGRGVPIAS
ncbi:MAG TPA: hypothetical protein VFB07_02315 [Vicinamibacterales bacterium]|nr:hypothetical protein [Vicinamibacterales bacterium]